MLISNYFKDIDNAYSNYHGIELELHLKSIVEKGCYEFGSDSIEYASLLGELGGYYRWLCKFELSEKYFNMAVSILKSSDSVRELATTLNNLAGTHRLMKNYTLAMEEFMQAEELYSKSISKDDILFSALYNNLSLLMIDTGKAEEADTYLEKAADILKLYPENVEEYASCLSNMGSLRYSSGQANRAIEPLEKALSLYETIIGTECTHCCYTLSTLGLSYMSLKESEKAYSTLKTAKNIAIKVLGENHPDCKSIIKQYEKAEKELPL